MRPATTFALIQELIVRDALRIALSGRDDVTLEPILSFLARHITDARFGEMASEVAGVIIGLSLFTVKVTKLIGIIRGCRYLYSIVGPNIAYRRDDGQAAKSDWEGVGLSEGVDEVARGTGHDIGPGESREFQLPVFKC